jgi:hypothetical protein
MDLNMVTLRHTSLSMHLHVTVNINVIRVLHYTETCMTYLGTKSTYIYTMQGMKE